MTDQNEMSNDDQEPRLKPRYFKDGTWFRVHQVIYDDFGVVLGLEGLGLYTALARYAHNRTGQCWPSLARLAHMFGCTQKILGAHLQHLAELGLIHLKERRGHSPIITLLHPPPLIRKPAREKPKARRRSPVLTKYYSDILVLLGRRDGFHCQVCKATTDLTIDHIIPDAAGGSDDLTNLRLLCGSCNSSKGGVA